MEWPHSGVLWNCNKGMMKFCVLLSIFLQHILSEKCKGRIFCVGCHLSYKNGAVILIIFVKVKYIYILKHKQKANGNGYLHRKRRGQEIIQRWQLDASECNFFYSSVFGTIGIFICNIKFIYLLNFRRSRKL